MRQTLKQRRALAKLERQREQALAEKAATRSRARKRDLEAIVKYLTTACLRAA